MESYTHDSPACVFVTSYECHPSTSESSHHGNENSISEQILTSSSDFHNVTDSELPLGTGSPVMYVDSPNSADPSTKISLSPGPTNICSQLSHHVPTQRTTYPVTEHDQNGQPNLPMESIIPNMTDSSDNTLMDQHDIMQLSEQLSTDYDINPSHTRNNMQDSDESDSSDSELELDSSHLKVETHLDRETSLPGSNSDLKVLPGDSSENGCMISDSGFNAVHSSFNSTVRENDHCPGISTRTLTENQSSLIELQEAEKSDNSSKSVVESKVVETVNSTNPKKKKRHSLLSTTRRKRRRNYWTTSWINSIPVKKARFGSAWTPCPEVPSTSEYSYCQISHKSWFTADPRDVMRKSSFIHSLGLVTHLEYRSLIDTQNQPKERKRRGGVVKKYDNLSRNERACERNASTRNLPGVKTEVDKRLEVLDCNVCKKKGSNIRCDFCASSFHIACLRVKSSRAPDPLFIPFCPKCVGDKCPPMLQAFDANESENIPENTSGIQMPTRKVREGSIPKLHPNKPTPMLVDTTSKSRSTVDKMPDAKTVLKIRNRQKFRKVNYSSIAQRVLPGKPNTTRASKPPTIGTISRSYTNGTGKSETLKSSTSIMLTSVNTNSSHVSTPPGSNRRVVKSRAARRPRLIASTSLLISRPTQYKTTPKLGSRYPRRPTRASPVMTRSSALIRKLSAKKILTKRVAVSRRSSLRKMKRRNVKPKSTQGLKLNSVVKGNSKSKKEYTFVTKLDRMVMENFSDENLASKDELISTYQKMKDTRAKLKSVQNESKWQLSVQRSIFDEFKEKNDSGSLSSMLLQNLKTTIFGTVELTKQVEEAISPLLNNSN